MARPPQSIAVKGADYPNKRGPGRRFEIAMCLPGEPVELRREPKNPADSRAIGVYSARGIQIGYIPADYAQWLGGQLQTVRAIFQSAETWGAAIRVTFDGSEPVLPAEKPVERRAPAPDPDGYGDDDWPPREPEDDFGGI
ncbi:HIRAN domain-containing protein [Sphingobium sp. SA916]|uniref:HIRAN domain-containing protein n=1 Tax=Sphingobium sp. SA916 TaxID=1851207 RepID=UPI00209BC1D6|nr:HIRAN domain-containing protein [Sphingobium sp. SA916]